MRMVLVGVLMLGTLAFFSVPATAPLLAQDKKKDKGKEVKAGTIEISKGKDAKYRFSIRDAEGKFLANSGANNFETEKEAKEGAEEFRAVVSKAKIVVLPAASTKKADKDK